MEAASQALEFERAAALRDKIRAIERTMEAQKMAAFAQVDLDLLGLARRGPRAAVQLFVVRNGKLIGRDVFLLEAPREASDGEVLASFIEQYYARATALPREIYVPPVLGDPALEEGGYDGRLAELEAFLAARRGGPVHLRVPRRGEKRDLLQLAQRNAAETLAREEARTLADQGKTRAALEELTAALGLSEVPRRIEGYDISTFQGRETVGSMVVFEEGKPRSGEYRRFRVKTVSGPNDFASHQEVLRRRFRRAAGGDEGSEEERRWRLPDLVLIDGGKGQVSAAREVLDEVGLGELPVVGLAKEREELFLPGRSDPILLPPTSPALYLVQRIRDEAHRFAIGYHRRLRAKAATRSLVDELPGIGPKRRAALLRRFGSLKRVREAPVEEIAAVPGIGPRLAERIKAALEG
jgi:excinuclease ABC subunit C